MTSIKGDESNLRRLNEVQRQKIAAKEAEIKNLDRLYDKKIQSTSSRK